MEYTEKPIRLARSSTDICLNGFRWEEAENGYLCKTGVDSGALKSDVTNVTVRTQSLQGVEACIAGCVKAMLTGSPGGQPRILFLGRCSLLLQWFS